jgi:hypothetical protein
VAWPCPPKGARHVPEGPGGATRKDTHDCRDATALCRGESRSLLNRACEVCTERSHRLARWSLRLVARQRNYPPGKPVAFRENRCGLCSNEPNDPPAKPVGFVCPYAVYEFSPYSHSRQGRTAGGRWVWNVLIGTHGNAKKKLSRRVPVRRDATLSQISARRPNGPNVSLQTFSVDSLADGEDLPFLLYLRRPVRHDAKWLEPPGELAKAPSPLAPG